MNEFNAAVVDHLAWKSTFEESVRRGGNSLEVALVAVDNRCTLGRWLHHQSPQPISNPVALQMLVEVHAEFHRAAANVLALAHAGQTREAVRAMSPDHHYGEWSATLVTALKHYAESAPHERGWASNTLP